MHKRGFTFLEILFMVVVISVGLIAIMSWVPVAIQTKVKTEQRTRAIFLAQEIMEDTKHCELFNLPLPNWNFPDFGWTVNRSDDSIPNLRILAVRVWHNERPNDITAFDTKVMQR